MTVEQAILENVRDLTPEKQQEVLHFVLSLKTPVSPKVNRRSIKGICADLGVHLSKEDIAEARHEMWGNFPREDF